MSESSDYANVLLFKTEQARGAAALTHAKAAAQTLATVRQRLRTLLRAIRCSSCSSTKASPSCRAAVAMPHTDMLHTCAVLETCLERCLGDNKKHCVEIHSSSQRNTAAYSARPYIVGSHSLQSGVSQFGSSDQTAASTAAAVTVVPAWITALLAK
eukprot:7775-Heterococcus_DN1.PRE.3